MEKNQLKSGMWVKTRDNEKYMVLTNCDTNYQGFQDFCLINGNRCIYGKGYDDNLLYEIDKYFDIMVIYNSKVDREIYSGEKLKVVWEREDDFEFKNGDICYFNNGYCERILIFKELNNFNRIRFHLCHNQKNNIFEFNSFCDNRLIRLATEEEKRRLFEALSNIGKRWNPDKKELEDIIKIGDTCILWNDNDRENAVIGVLRDICEESLFPYSLSHLNGFNNAIKFETITQYNNFLNEEK